MLPVAARLKAEAVSALTKAICASSVSSGSCSNMAQRVLVRILCIFVDRIPYRDLSDRARNEAVKLPAVAGGPDLLIRTDHHHRNCDPLQQLRQSSTDPGGIKQDAAERGGAFPPTRWRRRSRRSERPLGSGLGFNVWC